MLLGMETFNLTINLIKFEHVMVRLSILGSVYILDKVYGDQIEDKFITTVAHPNPAPIPGFYDQNGMPCNPYMQSVVYQPPIYIGLKRSETFD